MVKKFPDLEQSINNSEIYNSATANVITSSIREKFEGYRNYNSNFEFEIIGAYLFYHFSAAIKLLSSRGVKMEEDDRKDVVILLGRVDEDPSIEVLEKLSVYRKKLN